MLSTPMSDVGWSPSIWQRNTGEGYGGSVCRNASVRAREGVAGESGATTRPKEDRKKGHVRGCVQSKPYAPVGPEDKAYVALPPECGKPGVCGLLGFWLYGMRPASHGWQEEYTRQLEKIGFVANPMERRASRTGTILPLKVPRSFEESCCRPTKGVADQGSSHSGSRTWRRQESFHPQ